MSWWMIAGCVGGGMLLGGIIVFLVIAGILEKSFRPPGW